MKKINSQIMYNLKKDKGSYISFGIVVLITAIMLNLAFVLLFQVDKAYDKKFDELNTAAINVTIPKLQNTDELMDDLKALNGVVDAESREAVFAEAVVKDFRATDFSMNTLFYNKDESRNMNRLDIKEEKAEMAENSIYLPLYVSSFGEFGLDDEIVYEIGNTKHTFKVSGVAEEMQYGNYGKGLMGAYLPEKVYEKFADEYSEQTVVEYSIMTNGDINTLQNDIIDLFEEKGITMLTSGDRASTKDTRTMVCNLIILVLSAFAMIILLVSMFLCKFRISNSIEEDMVNMGVLKALGYTGDMIIAGVIMPYLMVTILASLLGVAVSYAVLPGLGELLTLQAGFSFALAFDVKGLICVTLILAVIVAFFTYTAAKRIRKLQPINAIRGNGEGKSAKKNYFPIDETKGKTKLLLVLKQTFSNGKQNILLFGVSFVLTILVAFASTMFYNVIIEPDNFISTLSEEMPQIIVTAEENCEDELKSHSEIKSVLKYTVGTVNIGDMPVTVFACEDFGRVSNDLCYLGENPDEKNEIALGSAFEEKYSIGDIIEIQNGDISRSYKVTGFVQSVNYQGNVCEFSLEGYEGLNSEKLVPTLYVYLNNAADTEKIVEEIEENYSDMVVSIINYQKMTETTQEMYSGITSAIVVVIFILTILIVLFVLYIVIKTLLVQRKQELGIYKAIGYSNKQLMVQMIGSFLPSSVVAVLLSSVLGLVYVPQINQFIFQTIGAIKNNMEVSFAFLMIFAFVQITANLIISILLTKPIKKISAYALIKEG